MKTLRGFPGAERRIMAKASGRISNRSQMCPHFAAAWDKLWRTTHSRAYTKQGAGRTLTHLGVCQNRTYSTPNGCNAWVNRLLRRMCNTYCYRVTTVAQYMCEQGLCSKSFHRGRSANISIQILQAVAFRPAVLPLHGAENKMRSEGFLHVVFAKISTWHFGKCAHFFFPICYL